MLPGLLDATRLPSPPSSSLSAWFPLSTHDLLYASRSHVRIWCINDIWPSFVASMPCECSVRTTGDRCEWRRLIHIHKFNVFLRKPRSGSSAPPTIVVAASAATAAAFPDLRPIHSPFFATAIAEAKAKAKAKAAARAAEAARQFAALFSMHSQPERVRHTRNERDGKRGS